MDNKIYSKEFKRLNKRQREAVEAIEGPVMVIAGPGTGKTQIMAMRIAQILKETQTNANNILALTFTESGVTALKERLLKIIGLVSYQVHVHTFHSFCNEIILSFPEKFLFAKKLNQLNDLDQVLLVQDIINQTKLNLLKPLKAPYYYQNSILKTINDLKQENVEPQKFKKIILKEIEFQKNNEENFHNKGKQKGKIKASGQKVLQDLNKNLELYTIYKAYQQRLKKEGRYDYADMILFVLRAFRYDNELLSFYQEKFQYFLVDEYQDTNSAQNQLVDILASFYEEPNIFVVGDDEQSIYRFQGAALENILYFTQVYPNTRIIVLNENYRSGQFILDSSRKLILNNKNQIFNRLKISKNLLSKIKNYNGEISLGEFTDGSIENFFIAKEIKKLLKKGVKASNIAILYRQHQDILELTEILAKLNITYQLEIGSNILEDLEIQKIIKFLNILDISQNNFQLNQTLFEVLHYPFLKLPIIDIYRINRQANVLKKPILDIILSQNLLQEIELEKPLVWKNFRKIYLKSHDFINSHTFAESFEFIINETGFLQSLLKNQNSIVYLEHLNVLFDEIKKLNVTDRTLNIRKFNYYLDLLKENNLSIFSQGINADFDGVRLMTAHKSKGLEFEIVFIIHVTDKHWGNKNKKELIKLPAGILKIQNRIDKKEEEDEEERRLFYVAITRAKNNIYLTWALKYGNSSINNIPSKFLLELPKLKKIKTLKYENKLEDQLKLRLLTKKWQPHKALNKFIESLLKDFYLSPTALNNYIECPRRFFLDNLLRVPKTKDFNQSYGTAIHFAFQQFFQEQIKKLLLPSRQKLKKYFEKGLEQEILKDTDFQRALVKGKEILGQYYEFYYEDLKKIPLASEYNFKRDHVHFDEVPITGVIDKLEIIDNLSNKVRIVDFKTSSPKSLNEIMGLTQKDDRSLFYQAYFYILLANTDPLFKYKIADITFDFLSPQNNKFKKVSVPINNEELEKFKKLVKKVYEDIQEKKFGCNFNSCNKYGRKCDHFDHCHS